MTQTEHGAGPAGPGPAGSRRLPDHLSGALTDLIDRRPDLAVQVSWFASLPSTMDEAARLAERGAPAGTVVVAGEQTAGRGRRGHQWSSPAGAGVYFTWLARPTRHVELVTLAAGVGVQRGIAATTGLQAHLKWPNDLLVGRRKLAGLLAEGVRLGTPDAAVLIGVGINLRNGPHAPAVEARATSIEAELGRPCEDGPLLAGVIEHLCNVLRLLDADQTHGVLEAWRALAPTACGARVEWTDAAGRHAGTTSGVDDGGALLVRTPGGLERVTAGELIWQP